MNTRQATSRIGGAAFRPSDLAAAEGGDGRRAATNLWARKRHATFLWPRVEEEEGDGCLRCDARRCVWRALIKAVSTVPYHFRFFLNRCGLARVN
jgi:hypothetical protein